MCSHKSITWRTVNNTVTDRMIDNSLTHKFLLTRNLRKRTKLSNSEIKKNCGVKDYKQYVDLKTNVIRNLVEDIDTDDPDFLTDGDYDMIYSSPSKQAKYVAENIEKFIFTSEDDYEGYKRKKSTSKKNKGKNTTTRVQNKNAKSTVKKKKPSQAESYTKSSKKCINIGWQDVIKGNRDTLHLSNNQVHALENEAVFKSDYDYLNTQSPSLFDSHNNNITSIIIKSENENIDHQNDGDYSAASDKLNPDDTICNIESSTISSIENDTIYNSKTKPVNESTYRDQNSVINQSNNELNSQSSHYQVSQIRSTILDNINNAGNELNSVIKLESSDNKLTEISNKTLINAKSDNRYVNNESNLLKNVRRNLISMLEKTDSTDDNKNVQQDKSAEDRLITNDDQSLPPIANSSRRSTLLQETRANVSKMQNLSSDISSLDQQKDSGIDEDSQDKIERSNVKNSTNLNIARKIPVSPQQIKNITETNEVIASKDSKHIKKDIENTDLKLSDDSLGEQDNEREKEFSGKEKAEDSSRLNKDNKDVQTCSISKEDKTRLVKQESCHIPDSREEKSSEEEVKDLQLNQIDKNTETLINQEEKTHFVEPEDLCDIQNQQLSPKKERTEDAHSESCINILEEQSKTVKKEEENFLHLNQVDEDTEINHEDKTHVESEETCSILKQQLLPKVTCTEIISKKYKIINTKINDVESNIKKSDNVNINTSIVDKNTPIKNNQNIDNWQKINTEEIDNMLTTSETDNEEDNPNYMSPQTKKRLQQQARLNLVVSDSSESDEECTNIETLKNAGNSDTNDSSEDSKFKSDKINRTPKKTNADISYNKDVHSKETTPIPVREVIKLNSRREINKKDDEMIPLTKCTYENVNSFKSATDENPLKKMQSRENAYNSNNNENKYTEDVESYRSKSPESNSLCDSERYVNQFSRDKQSSLLDKENVCNESNRCEDSTRDCTSEHESSCSEQNMQMSTNCSNAHVDTSLHYRPCNLDELVEDHELLPETISPGFTIADLSEDDEAFILNIPSKVLQYNLQDELMLLKSKTIKFGENKYRVVRRKIGTTTCILATGKERKPYKIVNIKQVSTITVRERLPHRLRKSDIITSKSKSKLTMINNRQIEETSSKMPKVSNHSKRSIENSSSDTETKQSAIKKKRLKVTHS